MRWGRPGKPEKRDRENWSRYHGNLEAKLGRYRLRGKSLCLTLVPRVENHDVLPYKFRIDQSEENGVDLREEQQKYRQWALAKTSGPKYPLKNDDLR
jgi:hypothetical protein